MRRGFIRIIAGKWRGRQIKVPDVKDLRPTPDRVRETLFNWLNPLLPAAVCLDAFAGTGILGFEALSRGAKKVVWVDHSRVVVQQIKIELEKLKADNAVVYQAVMPKRHAFLNHRFDIVFLDPPYSENVLLPSCFFLEEEGLLAEGAYLYLEAPRAILDTELPANWECIKREKAGQVYYYLARRKGTV